MYISYWFYGTGSFFSMEFGFENFLTKINKQRIDKF